MRHTRLALAAMTCGIAISLFTSVAQARDSKVNCNSPGANGRLANVLSRLDPGETNVVHVSGKCHENLVITGFDRLSLIADPGAVLEDASGGQLAVVEIRDSQRVVVQGFTIRGGNEGLFCRNFSFCRFIDDTIEGTSNKGTNDPAGIWIAVSGARLTNVVVRDAAEQGIALYQARVIAENVSISNVTAGDRYPGIGINMVQSSQLDGGGTGPVTIQDTAGPGVVVRDASHLGLGQLSVKRSGLDGIQLWNGSNAVLFGPTVTANAQHGVLVGAGSNLELQGGAVTDNQLVGVNLILGSNANIFGSAVTNNFAGVTVFSKSSLIIRGTTVTSNRQFGLYVTDLSYALIDGGTFALNALLDIACGDPPVVVQGIGSVGPASTSCPPSVAAPANVLKGLSLPPNPNLPPN